MSDVDIFRDAVEVIAATPTGQGDIHLGGVPAYNERYSGYATRTLSLLREYLEEGDEIAFASLPPNSYAKSDRRWGANIRVDQRFRDRLGVVAVLLMHEGCHLLREVRLSNGVEQEVICRTLGVCVYRDLIAGVRITSFRSVTSSRSMRPATVPRTLDVSLPARDAPIELSQQNLAVQAGRLVDWVLNIRNGYAHLLTAEWISRSIDWWGGLRNRTPTTKGHYLRVLAQGGETYAALILRLLESLVGPTYREDWDAMTTGAAEEGGVSEEEIRRALRPLARQAATAARLRAIEQRFPIDLGCGGAASRRAGDAAVH